MSVVTNKVFGWETSPKRGTYGRRTAPYPATGPHCTDNRDVGCNWSGLFLIKKIQAKLRTLLGVCTPTYNLSLGISSRCIGSALHDLALFALISFFQHLEPVLWAWRLLPHRRRPWTLTTPQPFGAAISCIWYTMGKAPGRLVPQCSYGLLGVGWWFMSFRLSIFFGVTISKSWPRYWADFIAPVNPR